jgi:teichuronic acid biosynthesis glycosyltransferase TuaC
MAVRALVVSNMLPDAAHPERGSFVRDQAAALGELDGVHVELFEFAPGPRALAGAALELRRRFSARRAGGGPAAVDVVHAHFGLSAWPAFAVPAHVRALTVHGTDLSHPRTRLLTRAALPLIDLVGAASRQLAELLPPRYAGRARVLPCGVDVERFRPLDRAESRAELGLDVDRAYLLFAADPSRAVKRHDRARLIAQRTGAALLELGGVPPARVPLWINAANAVLVPSDREGFGLAAVEALACDVPVLATPVGVHSEALAGIEGVLCAPFDVDAWAAFAAPHLARSDPRVAGRERALRFSTLEMARRVVDAWRDALEARRHPMPAGRPRRRLP